MTGSDLVSPVSALPGDETEQLEDGIAVCLSGGGYRAMLFHTGVLWRLFELGLLNPEDHSAKLPSGQTASIGRLKRVSSVSGGSIISGLLGLKWKTLKFGTPQDRFSSYQDQVVSPYARSPAPHLPRRPWKALSGSSPTSSCRVLSTTTSRTNTTRTSSTERRSISFRRHLAGLSTPPISSRAPSGASCRPTCATGRSVKTGTPTR